MVFSAERHNNKADSLERHVPTDALFAESGVSGEEAVGQLRVADVVNPVERVPLDTLRTEEGLQVEEATVVGHASLLVVETIAAVALQTLSPVVVADALVYIFGAAPPSIAGGDQSVIIVAISALFFVGSVGFAVEEVAQIALKVVARYAALAPRDVAEQQTVIYVPAYVVPQVKTLETGPASLSERVVNGAVVNRNLDAVLVRQVKTWLAGGRGYDLAVGRTAAAGHQPVAITAISAYVKPVVFYAVLRNAEPTLQHIASLAHIAPIRQCHFTISRHAAAISRSKSRLAAHAVPVFDKISLETDLAGSLAVESATVGGLADVAGGVARVVEGGAGLAVGGNGVKVAVAETVERETYIVVVEVTARVAASALASLQTVESAVDRNAETSSGVQNKALDAGRAVSISDEGRNVELSAVIGLALPRVDVETEAGEAQRAQAALGIDLSAVGIDPIVDAQSRRGYFIARNARSASQQLLIVVSAKLSRAITKPVAHGEPLEALGTGELLGRETVAEQAGLVLKQETHLAPSAEVVVLNQTVAGEAERH